MRRPLRTRAPISSMKRRAVDPVPSPITPWSGISSIAALAALRFASSREKRVDTFAVYSAGACHGPLAAPDGSGCARRRANLVADGLSAAAVCGVHCTDAMSFAPLAEACPDSASRPSVPRFVWRVPAGQRTRGLYARAHESVLFPLWQRIVHGRPIGPLLHLLETTERLPREERDRMQLASLRALLDHAGRNVPYWRDLSTRIGCAPRGVHSPRDLLCLPLPTRYTTHNRI